MDHPTSTNDPENQSSSVELQSLIQSTPSRPYRVPPLKSDAFWRRLTIAGVAYTIIAGLTCILAGVYLLEVQGTTLFTTSLPWYFAIIPDLLLSSFVTVGTESAGHAQATALRSALIEERRLLHSANARLFTVTQRRKWTSPNGILCNVAMALLLPLSFVSSGFIITTDSIDPNSLIAVTTFSFVPMVTLGVCLILQFGIVVYALRTTRIMTWDSDPLTTLVVLLHRGLIHHVEGHALCAVAHVDETPHPEKPSSSQPSLWQARPEVKVVICLMWCVAVFYALMGIPSSVTIPFHLPVGATWFSFFCVLVIAHGILAIPLHLAGLVTTILQDEKNWRRAAGPKGKGARVEIGYLRAAITPLNVPLMLAKPFLHSALSSVEQNIPSSGPDSDTNYFVSFQRIPMLVLGIVLAIYTAILTLYVIRRPRGPQPAAYGNFQVLANIIDEWPEENGGKDRLFWGDKGEYDGKEGSAKEMDVSGRWSHAGTSGVPLEQVKMNVLYA